MSPTPRWLDLPLEEFAKLPMLNLPIEQFWERVQAFAVLLAVAKAAIRAEEMIQGEWGSEGDLTWALQELDEKHPGWKEWTA